MQKIILIRHGETDWNAEQRLQGSIERPLNAAGIAQAEQLGHQFATLRLSKIYASPMIRARQTAEEINRHHGLEIQLHSDLREGSFGAAEGMRRDEYHAKYAPRLQAQAALPHHERIRMRILEDSESLWEVASRALPALQAAAEGSVEEAYALVVTHGMVIRAVLSVLFDLHDRHIFVDNGGYVILGRQDSEFLILEHSAIRMKLEG